MHDGDEGQDEESGVRSVVGAAQSIEALLADPTQEHMVHLLAGRLIGPAHGRSWPEVRAELAAILSGADLADAAG